MASEKIKGANHIVVMEGQGVLEGIEELKKKIFELEKQYKSALNFKAPRRSLLEIVVRNGKELQNVHRTHSLETHLVVFIGDKDGKIVYGSKKQKPVDLNGGSNPEWDAYYEFIVDIDEAWLKKHYLFVRVESKRKICSGSKFVGEYSVSIEDLLNDYGDAAGRKSFTRSVMKKKGEAHGTVTFECKFGGTPNPQPADPLPQPANGRHNSNGHPFLRAFAGDVVGELVTTAAEEILDEVLNGG